MPTIGKIRAELLGDTRQFDRSMQRSGRRVRTFREQLGGLRRILLPLSGAVGFGALVRSTFREADALGNLSKRLGTSVDAFSRLSRVLNRAGIGMTQSATILQRLQRRAADAQDGNEKLANAFRQLGINVDRLIAADPVAAFLAVADALARVERPAERIQLAFQLLDSEGVQVLQADLPRLREEMARTTGISDAQARSIKTLSDAWTRFGENLRSITAQVIEGVGGTSLVEALADLTGVVAQPGFVDSPRGRVLSRPPGFRHGPLAEMFDQLMAIDPDQPPRAPTAPAPLSADVLQRRGNVVTGGLMESNAILQELRGIRRNTETQGAVLE